MFDPRRPSRARAGAAPSRRKPPPDESVLNDLQPSRMSAKELESTMIRIVRVLSRVQIVNRSIVVDQGLEGERTLEGNRDEPLIGSFTDDDFGEVKILLRRPHELEGSLPALSAKTRDFNPVENITSRPNPLIVEVTLTPQDNRMINSSVAREMGSLLYLKLKFWERQWLDAEKTVRWEGSQRQKNTQNARPLVTTSKDSLTLQYVVTAGRPPLELPVLGEPLEITLPRTYEFYHPIFSEGSGETSN